jgi:hypothetical protein
VAWIVHGDDRTEGLAEPRWKIVDEQRALAGAEGIWPADRIEDIRVASHRPITSSKGYTWDGRFVEQGETRSLAEPSEMVKSVLEWSVAEFAAGRRDEGRAGE